MSLDILKVTRKLQLLLNISFQIIHPEGVRLHWTEVGKVVWKPGEELSGGSSQEVAW